MYNVIYLGYYETYPCIYYPLYLLQRKALFSERKKFFVNMMVFEKNDCTYVNIIKWYVMRLGYPVEYMFDPILVTCLSYPVCRVFEPPCRSRVFCLMNIQV